MGAERDVAIEDRKNVIRKFDDPEVCKFYLCGLNPYNLFHNTKSHLGHYDKVEDDDCKAQFEALSQEEKNSYGYEYDLMVFLEDMVVKMDREIARKQDRVRSENQQMELPPEQKAEIAELQIQIDDLLAKSEAKGEEGEVDEALQLNKDAEALRAKQAAIQDQHLPKDKRSHQQKTMEVCTVCGIFTSSVDSEERKRDHKNGKQYQGWTKVREKLVELKAKNLQKSRRRDTGDNNDNDRHPVSDGRDRKDQDYRDSRDSRDRRDRDRSYDRDRYDRDRYDRDRGSRDRDYSRGDRYRGSRDRGYDYDREYDRYRDSRRR